MRITSSAIFGTLLFSALVSPLSARSDQCAYISKDEADRAATLLSERRKLIEFCEPCRDEKPTAPIKIETVVSTFTNYQNYWEVLVNGKGIDLAYTYVWKDRSTYTNLAMLVGCPVQGVSQDIQKE